MLHALITDRSIDDICATLEQEGVSTRGNQDVFIETYAEFSIDNARRISALASLKAVGSGKYFILRFVRAGTEAQNALLKVVEEAPGNSHFYFSTESPRALIPTLRSRCIVEQSTEGGVGLDSVAARSFIKAVYSERLVQVDALITKAQRTGDRTPLVALVRALAHTAPCRDTLDAVRYIDQNGSSPKLILSHLAVSLPLGGGK